MNWIELSTPTQLQGIQKDTSNAAYLLYKHSPTCSICSMTKMRIERAWDFAEEQLKPYFLNVLDHRSLSDEVAHIFDTKHESPQILLVQNGRSVHQASHFDIDIKTVRTVLAEL